MEIGDLIRTERTKRGWSQRALAKALGISGSAIAQWELKTTRPSLARLIDICAVFGISAQSFLAPGSPYYGQIVEDPDEIALLTLWRRLQPTERRFMLKMLRSAGLGAEGDGDDPEPARELI
jgi:transcriptional regulator with XRE-family HTH domain